MKGKGNKENLIKKVRLLLLSIAFLLLTLSTACEEPDVSGIEDGLNSETELTKEVASNSVDDVDDVEVKRKPKMYAPNNGKQYYYVTFINDDPSDPLSGRFELSEEKSSFVYDGDVDIINGFYPSDYTSGKLYILENGKLHLTYEGGFMGGAMSGEGISYYANGKNIEYRGRFANNKRHDELGRMYYESGQLKSIANWNMNVANGEAITLYESGNIKHVGYIVNNEVNGDGILFLDDKLNSLYAYGQFKNGDLNGYATLFNIYGEKANEGIYENGEYIGQPSDEDRREVMEGYEKVEKMLYKFEAELQKEAQGLY